MINSFRLTDDEDEALRFAAQQTGKSRSEIVRLAILNYCQTLTDKTNQTPYQRLLANGFKPVSGADSDLSTNKAKQRKLIREKSGKSNR
jgi:predicted DNA-binding protein